MFLSFSLFLLFMFTITAAALAVLCIAKRKRYSKSNTHCENHGMNYRTTTHSCLPLCFRFCIRNEKSSIANSSECANASNLIVSSRMDRHKKLLTADPENSFLETVAPALLGVELICSQSNLCSPVLLKNSTPGVTEFKRFHTNGRGSSDRKVSSRKHKYTHTRASGTLCSTARRKYHPNRIFIAKYRSCLKRRRRYHLMYKQIPNTMEHSGNVTLQANFQTLEIWNSRKPANTFDSPWVRACDAMDDRSCVSRHTNSSFSSFGNSTTISPKAKDVCNIIADLYVPQHRIVIEKLIFEGTFGRLYAGRIHKKANKRRARPERWEKAMIKSVSDEATEEQIQVLLQNACELVGLVHRNLSCLVAASYTESESQPGLLHSSRPLLIYPYAEFGNLKQYLRSSSMVFSDQPNALGFTARNLVTMGLQLLKALDFLHGKKIVHKDVAARNCMLGRNFRVFLTDAALSRDLFPEDYQCLGDNTNRPIKWLALEALVERKYSSATDIWAAGVTLWELVTKCHQPYESLDAFEMIHVLRAGYRMCQPSNCPDDLWTMITACWRMPPDCRPSSKQLINDLESFQQTVNNYL